MEREMTREEYFAMFTIHPYAILKDLSHTIVRGWESERKMAPYFGKKVKIINWHANVEEAVRIEFGDGEITHIHFKDLLPDGDLKCEKDEQPFLFDINEISK